MKVSGTKTEKNLLAAFSGESQARNRYTYFASKAREEGFMQIADAFLETADQEKEHAKRFFTQLGGGMVEITAAFPAGVIGSTAENLRAAAAGEHEEGADLYPTFAVTAREEGFTGIAKIFEAICVAEKNHERRYLGLLKNVEDGTVFKKKESVRWRCRNCGYVHDGSEPPNACPACAHAQSYFELLGENW